MFALFHPFPFSGQVMDQGDPEEALIYAINSSGGNQTAINQNWVSPQPALHLSTGSITGGGGEGHTNGHYLPEHSIGLLVIIVGDSQRQDVYGRCIEETFR